MTMISQITFSGDVPDGMFIRVVPTADPTDEISYNYNITEFPGGPDVTLNHGINLTRGGDAKYTTEPSIGLMFEKNFKPTPNESYSEWYATWNRPGYGQVRPIAFRLDNNTGDAICVFNITELHVISPSGASYFGLNSEGLYLSFELGNSIKIAEAPGYLNPNVVSFSHEGQQAELKFIGFSNVWAQSLSTNYLMLYDGNLEWEVGREGDIGRPGYKAPRNIYALNNIVAGGIVQAASLILYDSVTNQPYSISIANGQLVINPV